MELPSVLFMAAFGMNSFAAALKAPDFEIAMPKPGVVVATAPKGHHFNVDAPMSLEQEGIPGRVKPSEAKKDRVTFPELKIEKGKLSVSLYLCDDKNTFCEAHRVNAAFDGKTLADIRAGAPLHGKTANAAPTLEDAGKLDPHGFILNDSKKALAQAKKEKKPLIIDFYGIWCPPCNELDARVFSTPEFEKATKGFVKLKLDADAEPSWELKARYKVGGYPTIVFADSNGEEIRRVVGTRTKDAFLKEIDDAYRGRDASVPALRARAAKGDAKAAGRLGAIHLERKEFAEAVKLLKQDPKTEASREKLAQAEIGLYEEKKDEAKLMAALESAVSSFPKSVASIDQRMKLAEIFGEKKETEKQKILLTSAIEAAKALIADPKKLEGQEYTAADLWAVVADAQEKLGEEKLSRKAWASAAEEYKKQRPAPLERGKNLELAYALSVSGDEDEAEEIYKRLEEAYPEEFTFYYAHASMKLRQKKASLAQPLAALALQFSYGDNQLRAGLLLAKVLKELGKDKDAITVIDDTLKEADIPKDESIRTHRYVKALKDYRAKLASAEKA